MTNQQYERLIAARRAGRNPDDPDRHVEQAGDFETLVTLAAAQAGLIADLAGDLRTLRTRISALEAER